MAIRDEQYNVLVKLMRGKISSPANIAARKVLVHGEQAIAAIHESGITRATVYQAIQRYSNAHNKIVKVFQDTDPLTDLGIRFDLILSLNRGNADAPSTRAARAVIVEGMAPSKIQLTNMTPPALYQAINRYRNALEMVSDVYPPQNKQAKPEGDTP